MVPFWTVIDRKAFGVAFTGRISGADHSAMSVSSYSTRKRYAATSSANCANNTRSELNQKVSVTPFQLARAALMLSKTSFRRARIRLELRMPLENDKLEAD
jgi:hypothetical protein